MISFQTNNIHKNFNFFFIFVFKSWIRRCKQIFFSAYVVHNFKNSDVTSPIQMQIFWFKKNRMFHKSEFIESISRILDNKKSYNTIWNYTFQMITIGKYTQCSTFPTTTHPKTKHKKKQQQQSIVFRHRSMHFIYFLLL